MYVPLMRSFKKKIHFQTTPIPHTRKIIMTRFALIPCFLIASACAPEAQEFSATPDSRDMSQEFEDGAERILVNPAGPAGHQASLGDMLVDAAIDKTGQLAKQNECEIKGALAAKVDNNLDFKARMLNLEGDTFGHMKGMFVFGEEKATGRIYASTSNNDQANRVKLVGDFVNSSIEADMYVATQDGVMSTARELTFFGEWTPNVDRPGALMLGVIADCR
ncbi:MAG: hypothetical protein CL930_15515 [Deltaproteobacteria bacterium]|nr:hypothetical protein [Deltaproteobacteria bacterium]